MILALYHSTTISDPPSYPDLYSRDVGLDQLTRRRVQTPEDGDREVQVQSGDRIK